MYIGRSDRFPPSEKSHYQSGLFYPRRANGVDRNSHNMPKARRMHLGMAIKPAPAAFAQKEYMVIVADM